MDFQKWVSRIGSEIMMLDVSYFQALPGEHTNLHTHPGQLHIACFRRGTGQVTLNGISQKVRPGMILIVYPGEHHIFAADSKRPYEACFLNFTWYGELPAEFPKEMLIPQAERAAFFRHCRKLSDICRRGTEQPGGEILSGRTYAYPEGLCPVAEEVLNTAIRLSVSEFFTEQDAAETVEAVRKVAAGLRR